MKNIPKRIYLQHGLTNDELKDVDFNEFNNHGNISWCKDQIEQNDICYVLELQNKELIEDNERLKGDLSIFKPLANEYMNDFNKCDVCGCHPSIITRTGKGTFCQEHVKY